MFAILNHVTTPTTWNVPPYVNLGQNSLYNAMFGILNHVIVETLNVHNVNLGQSI